MGSQLLKARITAVLCFALGGLMLWAGSSTSSGLPSRNDLAYVTAKIDYFERDQYGIDILVGQVLWFRYLSKTRDMDTVWAALDTGKTARIGFERRDMSSNRTIFSLEVDGQTVRSYSDIEEAWRGDNLIALIVGMAFITGGILCLLVYRKRPD
ncbi:MAG: hypothetical protein CMK07_15030 [Ponticaulis sp.]|nr:hypothetical protein [Ponticaulis sp.]